MKLESIRINAAAQYDKWTGYRGEITFSGEHGKVQIQVSERLSQRILDQCAKEIVDAAREVSMNMTADILEQAARIGIEGSTP